MNRRREALTFEAPGAQVFVPDGTPIDEALRRTTHLGVGAHPDDLEILAAPGILACAGDLDRWFTGVVVTDGAGSPRSGPYATFDDERMKTVRREEQHAAARIGRYSAVVQLSYASANVRANSAVQVVADLERVLRVTRPEHVYTHNLADRHDTHVAVALRLLEAARRLPREERPTRVIGVEVWRDLDWLLAPERVFMDLGDNERLQLELLAAFESQIAGGKRYDLASVGRRRAHATFAEHASVDQASSAVLGMDLTPLLDGRDPSEYVDECIRRFAADVRSRIQRLSSAAE